MTTEHRSVFDTNVTVSAVLRPRSVPRQAFDLALQSGKLLASQATIEELEQVLRRRKFDKYVSQRARLEFLMALVNQAEIVPVVHRVAACRDPDDNKFLELAVSGHATHIVSGDDDLLALHPFQAIAVVSATNFLAELKSESNG
jgi:putative PIN family toxin of toxin-antitoxin system